MSRKIIILTYYFPPYGGVAVQRVLSLVKYLKHFGWNPVVITTLRPKGVSRDPSVSEHIPEGVRVHRIRHFDLLSSYQYFFKKKASHSILDNRNKSLLQKNFLFFRGNFFLPDAKHLGFLFWKRKVLNICREEKPQLIFSTSPPHSIHILAKWLSKTSHTPWVCDFRDPWKGLYINQSLYQTSLAKKINSNLQRSVLQAADEVVCVSKRIEKEIVDLSGKKPQLVYNGFDPELFEENETDIVSKYFHIVFIGTYVYDMHPEALTTSLQKICQEDPEFKARLRITLAGKISKEVIKDFQRIELKNALKLPGFVTHTKAISYTKEASLLLLPLRKNKKMGDMLSAKTFEYLASRSEILSFGHPEYELSEILYACQRNPMLAHGDVEGTTSQILDSYQHLKKHHKPYKYQNHQYRKYDRKLQVKKISDIFAENLKTTKV